MKLKGCALIVLTASLVGCAGNPNKQQVAVAEPTVEPFNELLVSYTPTTYALVTNTTGKGATGLGGLGGLLGPLGSLAGVLIDHAIEAGVVSQSADRSKKLDQKIKANAADWDVNRAQAEYIAGRLAKETTLNVRVEALTTNASGVAIIPAQLGEKQVRLVVEAFSGYGANGATDSFKPVIVTKYAVQVGNPARKVMQEDLMVMAPQGSATFMTWEGLIAEANQVPAMAGPQLQIQGDKIATRLQKAWQKSVEKAQTAQLAQATAEGQTTQAKAAVAE